MENVLIFEGAAQPAEGSPDAAQMEQVLCAVSAEFEAKGTPIRSDVSGDDVVMTLGEQRQTAAILMQNLGATFAQHEAFDGVVMTPGSLVPVGDNGPSVPVQLTFSVAEPAEA